MRVLGINCSGFISSACLVEDGRVRFAITEERLSRVKRDRGFPHRAIAYCCAVAGIGLEEVDEAWVAWHPRFYLQKSDHSMPEAMRARGKMAYYALNELATRIPGELREVREHLETTLGRLDIRFVDHHLSHLAFAWQQSGFAEADFLTLDGFGETSTGAAGRVGAEGATTLQRYPSPHSLGSFYSAFTQYLGFQPDNDEWKVMALSAKGDSERFHAQIRALVRVRGLGFELDLSYFDHYQFFTPHLYSEKLVAALGPPVAPGDAPGDRECDLMAAVQRVSEEVVFELLHALHKQTGNNNLLVGGGFFMNSVCNGKLLEHTPYTALFLGGAPDDSGTAVGAALHGAAETGAPRAPEAQARHNYWGRTYSDAEIERELQRRKLRYQRMENPAAAGASALRAGKILGWFQGASEFGQRALGNRSILADPTVAEMKDKVNASVKYREGFRPFAPAVLRERQEEVLEMEGQTAYFMERVFRIRNDWHARIPAVVHFDGSGRPQTVDKTVNPLFHELIREFEALSGVPVVLNTSFNINGMPLVETPGDATTCFYACGLDALLLGPYLIEK